MINTEKMVNVKLSLDDFIDVAWGIYHFSTCLLREDDKKRFDDLFYQITNQLVDGCSLDELNAAILVKRAQAIINNGIDK